MQRECGLKVQGIDPEGQVHKDGSFREDDWIIEINGHKLIKVSFQKAQEILANALEAFWIRFRIVKKSVSMEVLSAVFPDAKSNNPVNISPVTLPSQTVDTDSQMSGRDGIVPQDKQSEPSIKDEVVAERRKSVVETKGNTPEDLLEDKTAENPQTAKETTNFICLKNDGSSLGIQVVPDVNQDGRECGLKVQGIRPGGRIHKDGRIRVDDRIVKINGHNLHKVSLKKAQEIFRNAIKTDEVWLQVVKSAASKTVPPADPPQPKTNIKPSPLALSLQTEPTDCKKTGKIIEIELVKDRLGLGFSITKRDNPTDHSSLLYVKNIIPEGAALVDGRLKPGDRLLEINGTDLVGKSEVDALSMLHNTKLGSTVKITVLQQDEDQDNQEDRSGSDLGGLMEMVAGEEEKKESTHERKSITHEIANKKEDTSGIQTSKHEHCCTTTENIATENLIYEGKRAETPGTNSKPTGNMSEVVKSEAVDLFEKPITVKIENKTLKVSSDRSNLGTPIGMFECPKNCPLWPQVPSLCPVPLCSGTVFSNLNEFNWHWIKKHVKRRSVSKCKICKEIFDTVESEREHMSNSHDKSIVIMKRVRRKNKCYKSPKGILPYQHSYPNTAAHLSVNGDGGNCSTKTSDNQKQNGVGIIQKTEFKSRPENYPLWPQTPTPCPVPACKRQTYTSFKCFLYHWTKVHCPDRFPYECLLCGTRLYGYNNIMYHWKDHEGREVPKGTEVKLKTVKVHNDLYIDPKDVLPYQLGSFENQSKASQSIDLPDSSKINEKDSFIVTVQGEQEDNNKTFEPTKEDLESALKEQKSIKLNSLVSDSLENKANQREDMATNECCIAFTADSKLQSTEDNSETEIKVMNVDVSYSTIETEVKCTDICSETDTKTRNSDASSETESKAEKTNDYSGIDIQIKTTYEGDLQAHIAGLSAETEPKVKDIVKQHEGEIKLQNTNDTDETTQLVKYTNGKLETEKEVNISDMSERGKGVIDIDKWSETKKETRKIKASSEANFGIGKGNNSAEICKGDIRSTPNEKIETISKYQVKDSSSLKSEEYQFNTGDFDSDIKLEETDIPEWPGMPTPCPVIACFNKADIKSFEQFMNHWTKFHHKKYCYFVCKVCGFRFNRIEDCEHQHKGLSKKEIFIKRTKLNKFYIDPNFDCTDKFNKKVGQKYPECEINTDIKTGYEDLTSSSRPVWPMTPTPCPVSSCRDTKFNSFKAFIGHWEEAHIEKKTCFHCESCPGEFVTFSSNAMKAHEKKWHHGTRSKTKTFEIQNIHYISPKDSLPYRLCPLSLAIGPPEARTTKESSETVLQIQNTCNSADQTQNPSDGTVKDSDPKYIDKNHEAETKIQNTDCRPEKDQEIRSTNYGLGTQREVRKADMSESENRGRNIDSCTERKKAIGKAAVCSEAEFGIRNSNDRSEIAKGDKNAEISSELETQIKENTGSETRVIVSKTGGSCPGGFVKVKKINPSEETISTCREESMQLCQPVWPGVPTLCPVPGCINTRKFKKFDNFILHWNKAHVQFILSYQCDLCGNRYDTERKAEMHKNTRSHTGKDFSLKKIKVQNKNYIETNGIMPYQLKGEQTPKSKPEGQGYATDETYIAQKSISKVNISDTGPTNEETSLEKESDKSVKALEAGNSSLDPFCIITCKNEHVDKKKRKQERKTSKVSNADISEDIGSHFDQNIDKKHSCSKKSKIDAFELDSGIEQSYHANKKNVLEDLMPEQQKTHPVWPETPSPCPVLVCVEKGKFESFAEFLTHWRKFHNKTSYNYFCKPCGKTFNIVDVSDHKHGGRVKIREIYNHGLELNDSFIDPLNAKPYQRPFAKQRKRKQDLKVSEQNESALTRKDDRDEMYHESEHLPSCQKKLKTSDCITIQNVGLIHNEKTEDNPIHQENVLSSMNLEDDKYHSEDLDSDIELVETDLSEWPGVPTPCPVPICFNKTKFASFEEFMTHWNELHLDKFSYFMCRVCAISFDKIEGCEHKHEKFQGKEMFRKKTIRNINYINPMGFWPYRAKAAERISQEEVEKDNSSTEVLDYSKEEVELPEWPGVPTPCSVPFCFSKTRYHSLREFMTHWTQFHQKNTFEDYRHFDESSFASYFIDPLGFLPYRAILPEEKNKLTSAFWKLDKTKDGSEETDEKAQCTDQQKRKSNKDENILETPSNITKIETVRLTNSLDSPKNETKTKTKQEEKLSLTNHIVSSSIETIRLTNFRDRWTNGFLEPYSGPCDSEAVHTDSDAEGPFKIQTVTGMFKYRSEVSVRNFPASLETAENTSGSCEAEYKARPIWPLDPALCPVSTCERYGKFSSFVEFAEHWSKMHTERKNFYQCIPCGLILSDTQEVASHKNSIAHEGTAFMINKIIVPNLEFIDPGDTLSYTFGTAEDRKKLQKEKVDKMAAAQNLLCSIREKLEAIKSKHSENA